MKNFKMKILTLAVSSAIGFAVIGAAPAVAQMANKDVVLTAADKQVVYRKLGFHAMRDNMKAIAMILKEGVGDKANIPAHAQALATTAKTISASMKPNVTPTNEKTTVLPKVWKEWDKFNEGVKNFEKLTAEFAQAASSGDMAAFGAKMGEVGKACKACHDDFREKKDKK